MSLLYNILYCAKQFKNQLMYLDDTLNQPSNHKEKDMFNCDKFYMEYCYKGLDETYNKLIAYSKLDLSSTSSEKKELDEMIKNIEILWARIQRSCQEKIKTTRTPIQKWILKICEDNVKWISELEERLNKQEDSSFQVDYRREAKKFDDIVGDVYKVHTHDLFLKDIISKIEEIVKRVKPLLKKKIDDQDKSGKSAEFDKLDAIVDSLNKLLNDDKVEIQKQLSALKTENTSIYDSLCYLMYKLHEGRNRPGDNYGLDAFLGTNGCQSTQEDRLKVTKHVYFNFLLNFIKQFVEIVDRTELQKEAEIILVLARLETIDPDAYNKLKFNIFKLCEAEIQKKQIKDDDFGYNAFLGKYDKIATTEKKLQAIQAVLDRYFV